MIQNKNDKIEDIKYPRFINSNPCGEDLFASKSQERIADNICKILQNDNSCKIIGIDGGWGSGKSNLVTIVRNKLEKDNFHFFIYDAWGHQEDLQRRSILEELTEDLTGEILKSKKWKLGLKRLLAKSREIEKKTIPSLSYGIVISILILVLTPVFKIISDNISSGFWKIIIMLIPFFAFIGLYLIYVYKQSKEDDIESKEQNKEDEENKEFEKKELKNGEELKIKNIWKDAFKRLFYLYQKLQTEDITYESISEDEPSVKKFRNYIKDISDDLIKLKYQLVIVFDNMDRLPESKVQELWSSIHTFFAENSYDNIAVIVPFDRKHIQTAFKQRDEEKNYGNDFINKTFNVVYRVSPPILSDWKKFFKEKWEEAFGHNHNSGDFENVVQIYDILSKDITPRRMIAFINEFVSTKQIQPDIPDKYVGLFILKKSVILSNPFEEIIKLTFLEGVDFIFKDDENLAKHIGALVYQIDPERAIQVIYIDKLARALNNNDTNDTLTISQSNEFYDILVKSLSSVSNVENATLCLNKLEKGIEPWIWENLYRKIENKPSEGSKLKEYQLILLQKISEKEIYLKKIIDELKNSEKFNAVDYYASINDLEKLNSEKALGLSIKKSLPTKQTNVQDYIAFLKVATDSQKEYRIGCDNTELDNYLSTLPVSIEELEKADYIPFIISEYNLPKYVQKLEDDINASKTVASNTILMGWLYKRYKETSNKKPVTLILEPQFIHSFFDQTNIGDEFYFDLIAMRISLFNNMVPAQYTTSINNVLQTNDPIIIDKLFGQIEYYVTYNNLLFNLTDYSKFPIYLEVVKKLTNEPLEGSHLSLVTVLKSFKTICENGIDPESLVKRLNSNQEQKTEITIENFKSSIPDLLFFQTALKVENELTEYCITLLMEYLDKLSLDVWKERLKNENSFEFQASILLKDYQYRRQAVDAIKSTLDEIAGQIIPIPGKENWNKVFEKLGKESLFNAFQDLRDKFCSQIDVTEALFLFFGDWLFIYGELEKRPDVTRRIFLSGILRNKECLNIISNHIDKLEQIIENADKNGEQEFKSTIKDLLNDENNDPAKVIADKLGIKKDKKKEKEDD